MAQRSAHISLCENRRPIIDIVQHPSKNVVFSVFSSLPTHQIRRDEDYDLQNERELARLRYENRYLKECLKIGRDFGSIPPEESESQT